MAAKTLSLVPASPQAAELYDLGRGPESTAQRVRRLQSEARLLAREEVERLDRGLSSLADIAAEIAAGGDAYPAGVREIAARLAADLPQRGQNLRAIADRTF